MFTKKNKIGKTNSIVMFLTVFFFVAIPAFCIWLLVGEVDLLNVDLLVAHNGALWKGNVFHNEKLIEWIIEKYNPSNPPSIEDKYVYIKNNDQLIFNPIMSVYALIPLFIAIILPTILILIKKSRPDIYVLSISFALSFFIFIITGLIPIDTSGWKWTLGLAIALCTFFAIFIPSNKLANAFLSTTKVGVRMAIDFQADKKIVNKYEKDLKDLVDNNDGKDNIEYIEVEE